MSGSLMTSIYGASDSLAAGISAGSFLLCSLASLVLGLVCAGVYMFRHTYSKNFVVTLALLPLIVQMTITLVNGNLGAGIAVMGVFNLVRFRSVPGSAKDICSVFLAMAIGLATGMGFLGLAALFTLIVVVANVVLVLSPLGEQGARGMVLRVTVPEDIEFNGLFDDVLAKYASSWELLEVQTSNMGSLFRLKYNITLNDEGSQKALIDEIRCLNGNLKVTLAHEATTKEEL